MKILYVCQTGDMGGGQQVCYEILRDQMKRGRQVEIACASRGAFTERLAGDGVAVTIFSHNTSKGLAELPAMTRFIRKSRPSLIHTSTTSVGHFLWRVAAMRCSVKVVQHAHTYNYYGNGVKSFVFRGLDLATIRYAAAVLAVSQHTADTLARQGYPRSRIRVIHNGISIDAPSEKTPRPSEKDKPVIICVGRLCQKKGQGDLIEAFARVQKQYPKALLKLAGSDQNGGGAYLNELRALTARLGLEHNVDFLGERADISALLKSSDVFALPSYDEALPISILEAMACSTPVVASDVAGIPEMVIDGETGLLMKPGHIDALSGALLKIIDDGAFAKRLADNAARRIRQHFALDKMLAAVNDVYENLVEKEHDRH